MVKKIIILTLMCLLTCMPVNDADAVNTVDVINSWVNRMINMPEAIKTDYDEESSVKIAVIDTGVKIKNLNDNQISPGKNYIFPDEKTNDLIGHGTSITSIILGTEDGNLKGVAPNATVVPLVYISKYPSGVKKNGGLDTLVQAIYDAVDVYECKVINISSGILADETKLKKAVEYAESKNVIVVSAVGNTNMIDSSQKYYPASYDTVIGVGAVNEDKEVAPFSQRNESVMVTAPGCSLYSVSIKNKYDYSEIAGTSYATAYISGLAALMIEKYPDMTPVKFRKLLSESCTDLGDKGYDINYGYGLVDIKKMIEKCELDKSIYN